ncbi:MAG: DUF2336 domain-containing protein [Methylocystis sp.]|uniref:DUF2336 domain-containing protein n=1 Tax=Methylocystis sp. TaxID=1911079 RepID=UPI003DA50B3E
MQADKSDRRTEQGAVLRKVVDQFLERQLHPIADYKQFEQLTIGMIDLLDDASLARILRPICLHPETSQAIFDRLLAKGGACAALAMEFSPRLPRAGLMAAARGGDPSAACAVARRKDLDGEIVAQLLRRGESEVMKALAENPNAQRDDASRRAIIEAARDDLAFARMLLDRDDFGAADEALFLAGRRQERGNMILNACRRALAAGGGQSVPADPELAAQLEAAAIRRDRDAMAATLARAFNCRKSRARAIVDDQSGEAMAMALSALGVHPDAATRIFLCADASISHDTATVRGLVDLTRITPQGAATEIISAVTGGRIGVRESPQRPAPPPRPATKTG